VANHKQAIKRNRQNGIRAERNRFYMSTARTFLKRARLALSEGDDAAGAAVEKATAFIDRIAGKGVIPRKRASRLKSRLVRQFNAR
jgi:small subunit ribosomal protein S20